MALYHTEYGDYSGKHIRWFMFKNVIKDFIRPLSNKIVICKYKNIWNVKEVINSKKLYGGIVTSYYIDYFNKRGSYIGLHSKFKNIPCFPHGIYGVFISDSASIGKDAVIFQDVTIGSNTLEDSKHKGAPTIGDNVYIGAGAKIIGNVKIGNNVRIGAGAIVCEDVEDDTLVVMEKPKLIKKKNMNNSYIKRIGKETYYYKDGSFHKDG